LLTASDRKLEFDNGTITMMAGGKRAHNKINRNTFSIPMSVIYDGVEFEK